MKPTLALPTVPRLPRYGVFSTEGGAARCGVAIGEMVLDLAAGPLPHEPPALKAGANPLCRDP